MMIILNSFKKYLLIPMVCGWLMLSAHAEEPIRFGVMPFLSAIDIMERFTPLVDLLEKQLAHPIKLVIPGNFQQLIDDLGEQKLDFVYFGPVPYLHLVKQYGPQPILAMEELAGKPNYHGVIFVRQESDIQKLQDLKGKRFTFGDPDSTMNHTVPRAMLFQAGISLNDLAEHRFVGNNQNVVLAVLMGHADAAGIKEDIYNKYQERGLRVIARSLPVPNLLYVAGRHRPESWVERMRQALTVMHQTPEGLAALKKIQPDTSALIPATDDTFQELRKFLDSDVVKP
ncbi:MAG: phosphate/phosphite/phosphonate ABC transporter substrate-binding protein [Magnetococcales bacterium]|nr:phosphate/phosphite/phosphonate ABC transporter substrate-binding protein [Magnetococcales bacterium]